MRHFTGYIGPPCLDDEVDWWAIRYHTLWATSEMRCYFSHGDLLR